MVKNNDRLPIIVSLPHGGLAVPTEVQDRLAINETTIYNECDLWVDHLYDFGHPENGEQGGQNALASVSLPIARVLIDANRPPDGLENPDGPVKTRTSYGEPIYQIPLTQRERAALLATYWQPFHDKLAAAFDQHHKQVKFFLDGHNMAQMGPTAYPDSGRPRPLIMLANFGDRDGNPKEPFGWTSCEPSLIRAAGTIAEELFQDLTLLEPEAERPPVVGMNDPFPGGYILATYAGGDKPIPGIMVEINRGLIVGNQRTDSPIQPPDPVRVAAVRSRLYQWMVQVLALLD